MARTSTKTSVPATVNIQIIPVNDEVPRIVNNTGVEVWAGSSALITTENLCKFYKTKIKLHYLRLSWAARNSVILMNI